MDWKKISLSAAATIRDAVKAIDAGGIQLACVVDDGNRLAGTVSDGDVRRALLRGRGLDAHVSEVMNRQPVVASTNDSQAQILSVMRKTTLHSIPVLDGDRRVVNVAVLNELLQLAERENAVVIMAGGLGSRLLPLTQDRPKPLLQVGSKPILETILDNCREQGFKTFYFAVNYMAEMIKDHFGDGSRWGVEIRYLEEQARLGTAGALSLLPERPEQTLLVMNGDVLTKVNIQNLLEFHSEQNAIATMGVRECDLRVPYGVVRLEGSRLCSIDEKPLHRFFVNAGIYALEPATLDLIPAGTYFDMTTLFEKLIGHTRGTAAFHIREYWIDIGRMNDLETARMDYSGIFFN
jgi:dTDP-glucose pyrophosphorylase/predicted transcriptional regulator